MYQRYDLLCRKLQRIKLKFNLNNDPSRQEKERQAMAPSTPSTPAPPGWPWRAHIKQEPDWQGQGREKAAKVGSGYTPV